MRIGVVLAASALLFALGFLVTKGDSGGVAAQSTPTPTPSPAATSQPSPTVSPTTGATPAPNCGQSIQFTEGHTLALEILSAQSNQPLVDEQRFEPLAMEINDVLARVRAAAPAMSQIGVFQHYAPGYLTLGLVGPLGDSVLAAFGGQQSVTSLNTGNPAFDALNSQLCFVEGRFQFSFSAHWFSFHLSDRLDVADAAAAYKQIEGVPYADPQGAVGDGSDIALEKRGDEWFAVFRDAFGDCPAGCIGQKLYCFVVSAAQVTEIDEPAARTYPSLVQLTATWGRLSQALCQPLASTPIEQPPVRLPETGGQP